MSLVCPEKPELLKGKPIGQYHCPHCGMMVMAGQPHLKFVEYESVVTEMSRRFGITEPGWYANGVSFNTLGPFETEDAAINAWLIDFKNTTGKDWNLLQVKK